MAKKHEKTVMSDEHESAENTIDYFYKLYMDDVKLRCKLSTVRMKQNVYETKVLPFFGPMKLCDVTPKVIREWQVQQSDPAIGRAPSYLHRINAEFAAFMQFMTDICDLPVNPCTRVRKMGSQKSRSNRFWTPEEYFKFRSATEVEPLAFIIFETLFWTAARVGEVLALTPEDIDLNRKEIAVTKTFQRVSGSSHVWEPKTNTSNRTIMIPDHLVEELKEYMDGIESLDKWRRVFPVTDDWLSYRIHKYAKIAGVRDINVHGLRHSAASLLINNGFGALEVSHRLGHSKPSITLNTYSHMFSSKQRDIVELLEDVERNK